MTPDRNLARQQNDFFRSLGEPGSAPGVHGQLDVYKFAYFERIRASVEEDYPLLFQFLESLTDFPGGVDAERVTRDLLARNHPHSWTLAEASLPVIDSVEVFLAEPRWSSAREEARRLARLDEAESRASWLEEWPEPKGVSSDWIAGFAQGMLHIVRSRTWCEAASRIFWRNQHGVRQRPCEEFVEFAPFWPLVEIPIGFAELTERASETEEPEKVTRFIQSGMAEGWLRLTP